MLGRRCRRLVGAGHARPGRRAGCSACVELLAGRRTSSVVDAARGRRAKSWPAVFSLGNATHAHAGRAAAAHARRRCPRSATHSLGGSPSVSHGERRTPPRRAWASRRRWRRRSRRSRRRSTLGAERVEQGGDVVRARSWSPGRPSSPGSLAAADGLDDARARARRRPSARLCWKSSDLVSCTACGVDGLAARPRRTRRSRSWPPLRRQHVAVLVAVPAPVEAVGLEGLVERLALQLGGVGDGADGAEQDG